MTLILLWRRRGGALCTLSAFDIAQEVDRIFATGAPNSWKTQAKPTVTAFAWASPRVGNYSFLQASPFYSFILPLRPKALWLRHIPSEPSGLHIVLSSSPISRPGL